jgi:phytoene synthase
VLEQLPRVIRPAIKGLWDIDFAFADIVATSSDPRLGAIRMAWWRERFEDLERGAEPPPEPRLQGASDLLRSGVMGAELAQLEDAWLPLLDPFPWAERQVDGLRLRGRILFSLGARLLGAGSASLDSAGELWSLVDGAHHCSDPASRAMLMVEGQRLVPSLRAVPNAALRPLTTLAALAAHDVLGRGGGVRRGWAALAHRYRGRMPQ